jgi:diguanylate cyclase (GGDEF)-like protein
VVSLADSSTGPLTGIGLVTILLVVATMALIGVLLVALRRGQRILVSAANTDALTGLFNRRRLIADLDSELARATAADPVVLILCDLNGFKAYNDTFGHPAGDALLARLGAALAQAMVGRGRAYRIGGDEFCVLARTGREPVENLIQSARDALSEHGEGFAITASHGAVLLPADASSATEAMRAVDVRMYENKTCGRVPADTQTINALLRAIQERDPQWAERLAATVDLVREVCRDLDVPPAEEARIVQAAQLHDVGKVAIPDAIIRKPGPLTPPERAFVRQAPAIGERITASAPALASVAALVRSAREHYDGTGYPQGLAGEDIPLGARIIAACSALVAMTSERPHARPLDSDEALAELDRASGSRFEPRVVAAIRRHVLLRIPAGTPIGSPNWERTGGELHAASGEVRQGDRRDPSSG